MGDGIQRRGLVGRAGQAETTKGESVSREENVRGLKHVATGLPFAGTLVDGLTALEDWSSIHRYRTTG